MTKRFRMIAGPNGSGKSTLADLLRRDYAVNFYTMLNADDIFAEVSKTHAYLPALPVEGESLRHYAHQSEYAPQTKAYFENGDIAVVDDTIRFRTLDAINTYTVALHPLANFISCKKGVLYEAPIRKEDIRCCAGIYEGHLKSAQHGLIKVIYYRRLLEVNGGVGTLEYNLVSSLLHKRGSPTIKNGNVLSVMSDADVHDASQSVAGRITGFDYAEFLSEIQDKATIRELYRQSTSSFEKLQLFRLLYENDETQLDDIVKKFVNEAYHVENEYLFGLDPSQFDIVPAFVIEKLDAVVNVSL